MLDLFCGRFGWGRAFAERGWEVVGIDLVEPPEIPQGCRFIRADVLSIFYDGHHSAEAFCINGEPFQPDFICASSPCEQFSVFGMPHFHPNPPYPSLGLQLFNHAREICKAAGVPYVMENVRAAQKFAGKADHNCGPFYLWGTGIPPILPQGIRKGISQRVPGMKSMTREQITEWRRENDPMWSSSKGEKRREQTAKAATIPPELANCVVDYAERILVKA